MCASWLAIMTLPSAKKHAILRVKLTNFANSHAQQKHGEWIPTFMDVNTTSMTTMIIGGPISMTAL